MMRDRRTADPWFVALLCAAVLLTGARVLIAGGPLIVDPATGTPYTWQVPLEGPPNAFFNIEAGPFNALVDNATAQSMVAQAFIEWQNVPSAAITYSDAGPLQNCSVSASPCLPGTPLDVNALNFLDVFGVEDGQSPIIFDSDGSIFSFLGFPPGVLAFASPEVGTDGAPYAITEGIAVFNGSVLLDLDLIRAVMVHEFGHFSNLGHSAVNGQAILFNDEAGPSPYDPFGFGVPPIDSIETMYPFLDPETSVAAQTLHADDIASISAIYPSEILLPPAAITGQILRSDSVTGISGVNVIARNVNNPFYDAVSALSGDYTQGLGPLGENDGLYTLRGLAGGNYAVYIDEIQEGGYSTTPAYGFEEECYNGLDESSDPVLDDPSACSPVAAASTVTGIDVILQALPPDPNEPNNDPASATDVACGQLLSDVKIDPIGDLDFYAIDLVAGEELVVDVDASVLGSPLDSLVGIFAPDGITLLAVNDDEATFFVDSLLIFSAPSDGRYYVAVTAWDDFDFDGTSDTGAVGLTTGSYSVHFLCNLPPVPLDFEAGRLLVDDQWQPVTFTREFVDPIVIAGPASSGDSEEALVRVRNVSPTGFEVRLQEWDFLDGAHPSEEVSYVVVERGRFVLPGGGAVEAGSFLTDNTGVGSFQTVGFSPGFSSSPVVLTTIGTFNDPSAVTTRLRGVSGSQFEVTMQEEEAADQVHGEETIYFLAWQVGTGQSVATLAGAPAVQTLDYDSSTATVSHTFQRLLRSSLEAQVQEERSADAEVGHLGETVGYVILGRYGQTPILFAQMQTSKGIDPSAVRWRQIGMPFQSGTLTVNTNWKTVPISGAFENPVVVAQSPSYYGANSGVIRIRNVTRSSFDIRFQEWLYLDGLHTNEEVTYFVAEAGIWELPDGSELQAGYLHTDQTGVSQFLEVPMLDSLSEAPVVLSSLNSFNGSHTATTRLRNVEAGGFEVTMQEEEGNDQIHNSERIGFIAFPLGSGTLGSLAFEVTSLTATDAFASIPETLFEVRVDEEQSVDPETVHGEETVGVVLVDGNLMAGMQTTNDPDAANLRWRTMLPGLETGLVMVDSNWRTVVLEESYVDPVIVARPASHNDSDPGVIRIRNVTSDSFEILFQEWLYLDDVHATEEVAFMVMESGRHFLPDGEQIEAGYIDSSNTGTNAFVPVGFVSAFPAAPAVVSSMMTFGGAQTATPRLHNVTNLGFLITIQEEEANDQIHAVERLSYIAWEPGSGTLGAKTFESSASFSANSTFTQLNYSQAFGSAPCVLADMQIAGGPDPSNLRQRNRTSVGVEMLVDEESSLDAETGHLFETIGYIAIDCATVEATAAPSSLLLQVSSPSQPSGQRTETGFPRGPVAMDPAAGVRSEVPARTEAEADQCDVEDLIFPWSPVALGSPDDRLSFTALVINPHPVAVQMELRGLSDTGSELLLESRVLRPRQVHAWTSDELSDPDLATLVLTSERPLDGFNLVGNASGVISGISARLFQSRELTLPLAGEGSPEDLFLFLFNHGREPIEATVELVHESGDVIARTVQVLTVEGSLSKSLREMFEEGLVIPASYVRVTASEPLLGVQLDTGSGALAGAAQPLATSFSFIEPMTHDEDSRVILGFINAGQRPARIVLERRGASVQPPLDPLEIGPGEALRVELPRDEPSQSNRISSYLLGAFDQSSGFPNQVVATATVFAGNRLVGWLPVGDQSVRSLVAPILPSAGPSEGNRVEFPLDRFGRSFVIADLFDQDGAGVGRAVLGASSSVQVFGLRRPRQLDGVYGFIQISGQVEVLQGGRLYWNGGILAMSPSAVACRE